MEKNMHKRTWSFLAVLAMLAMPLTAMAAPASTPDNPVFFSLLPPLFTIIPELEKLL